MVQHIVFWNFKEDVKIEEKVVELQQVFSSFCDKIDGLLSLKVYKSYQGYHACLVSKHISKEALEHYQNHPEHAKARKIVHESLLERASCDFEL